MNCILEKQYEKVFAPLHKAIFFENNLPHDEIMKHISKIVSDNYLLVPPEIIEALIKKDETLCERLVKKAYEGARSKLGYSQYKKKLDDETLALIGKTWKDTWKIFRFLSGYFPI
ncbi:MAG: hypothetical protein FWB80_10960 [Defluviitaleaceae bacterium]|nr:hypothetical protein [Defluviitaleaceae bacterium]